MPRSAWSRAMSGFGDDLLERCLSQGDAEVLWTGSIGRNKWQIDVGRHRQAEFDLRLLSRLLQTLVVGQFDSYSPDMAGYGRTAETKTAGCCPPANLSRPPSLVMFVSRHHSFLNPYLRLVR